MSEQCLLTKLPYLLDKQGIQLTGVDFRKKARTSTSDRAHVETEVLEWSERYLQIQLILDVDSTLWQKPLTGLRKLRKIDDAEHWTSQVLTDTLGVIVETWEGLWGINADRSLSD